jgi:hypothetical protein
MSLEKVKITRKNAIGVQPVFDISVPGAHHYLLDSGIVSHNSGFIYASSIVVAMKRLKLKEDEDGNKTTEVKGIRAACKIMKTRYSKPFETVQVKIPYDRGMSPTSGLVELFEHKGLLEKDGNRLRYITNAGVEIKLFRKAWEHNEDGCLDQVMLDFKSRGHRAEVVEPDLDLEQESV